MTRPVGIRAIWRGATVTSADADRSNPADSAVAYVGRGTVASSRLIRICIGTSYLREAPPPTVACGSTPRRQYFLARPPGGRFAWVVALLLAVLFAPASTAQDLNAP